MYRFWILSGKNWHVFREKRTRRLSLYREKQIEENEEEFRYKSLIVFRNKNVPSLRFLKKLHCLYRQKVRSASAKYIKKQLELDPDFL